MVGAPVGIAGEQVPFEIGVALARQGFDHVAGIKCERAAIPATAGRTRIHAQRETKAVILVGGQVAFGVEAALVVNHAGEFLAPQGHFAVGVAIGTQQALAGGDRTGGLVGNHDRHLAGAARHVGRELRENLLRF